MQPQFKPLTEEIKLSNTQLFWVPPEATHISFKNGMMRTWILLNPPLAEDHRSTNNRWFIKKEGNSFYVSEFEYRPSGYHYGDIDWAWRCRTCENEFPLELLSSKEICRDCNHGP